MATASLPDWIPPARYGVRTIPAGRFFDAVEVESFTVACVLGGLAGRSGPVIEDQARGVARWLVAPGDATGWALPGVHVLGRGHYVAVPPAEWCCGLWLGGPPVRWLVPPAGSCLSDPIPLRKALTRAVTPAGGPRHAVPRRLAEAALAEPKDVVVTGLEGPLNAIEPVTCSYCRLAIVVDDDHAADCAWRPGKAVTR